MIEHEVKDYNTWKRHFDKDMPERKKSGATGKESVYRDVKDPNKLIIAMEWKDKEGFERMMNSDKIKQVMDEAGVIKVPSVTYYEGSGTGKEMMCTCEVMQ